MATETYRHTQIGWSMLVVLATAAVITIAVVPRSSAFDLIAPATLSLCLFLFASLTVAADQERIEARFGLGLIRKTIHWAAISSARPVRNSPLLGLGIRWIGTGWMFNVSGLNAVELSLKNGKVFRIGTDDPAGLNAFIERRLRERA